MVFWPRTISATPISSSKLFTWRLKAGCVRCNWFAARLKLPCAATAAKYRRCRSSIDCTLAITKSMSNPKNTALANFGVFMNSLGKVRSVDEKEKRVPDDNKYQRRKRYEQNYKSA